VRPEEIVEQFDGPVRRWFARRVREPADAEDLAQETIIAAVESLRRFRGESSPRTWVYAIARNQLLKYIRGARRQTLPLENELSAPEECCAADRIAVQVIVSHLPLSLRQVYRLYYRDRLTTEEIARELRRSRGTVKYQLYEVRRRVRRALE
jgi:RNA polymerase sigma factor (sigma-70 family)